MTAAVDHARPLTASENLRRRARVSRVAEALATTAALLAVGVLGIVVYSVARRGADALSIDFLIRDPPQFGGGGGGIASAIVGTAAIIAVATVIAAPLGVLIALYLTEYAGGRAKRAIGLGLDLMNGLPAIVVAVFVFGLLVAGNGQTGFAASFALAIIMLPLVARASEQAVLRVPDALREAADALGVSRWRTILGILLPGALTGILTGVVLAVARAAGETAPPLILSSLATNSTTLNVFGHPVANIPVLIYQASEAPDPAAISQAWGAGFVLLAFILVASLAARTLLARSRGKHAG